MCLKLLHTSTESKDVLSLQDYNTNMTGSAVIPFVESTGFAQLYMRFYRTNDNHSNSAQVMTGLRLPQCSCSYHCCLDVADMCSTMAVHKSQRSLSDCSHRVSCIADE